jgi:hypothetical protein
MPNLRFKSEWVSSTTKNLTSGARPSLPRERNLLRDDLNVTIDEATTKLIKNLPN